MESKEDIIRKYIKGISSIESNGKLCMFPQRIALLEQAP